jgi:hypothetical protein
VRTSHTIQLGFRAATREPLRRLAIWLDVSVNAHVGSQQELPNLVNLAAGDAAALKALWRSLFKSTPPRVGRKEFFVRILGHEIQRRTFGDLSKASAKALRAFEEGRRSVETAGSNDPHLRAGTRLIREWGGATHEVMVMERGYAYRGRSYTSLSEIARNITGAHWSGPRFFGLRSQSRRDGATKAV